MLPGTLPSCNLPRHANDPRYCQAEGRLWEDHYHHESGRRTVPRGYRALVIDSDAQASAYMWKPSNSLLFKVIAVHEAAVQSELTTLA